MITGSAALGADTTVRRSDPTAAYCQLHMKLAFEITQKTNPKNNTRAIVGGSKNKTE